MDYAWERRIERAQELAATVSSASEAMEFYGRLLRWQQGVYDRLGRKGLIGSFDADIGAIVDCVPSLLEFVMQAGSPSLGVQARELSEAPAAWAPLLRSFWEGTTDFFARACLQPYLQVIAPRASSRQQNDLRLCRVCEREPQLAMLSSEEGSAADAASESGSRFLMCGECWTVWPYARVSCAGCGETDPQRLSYYSTEAIPSVRVDCCDSCRRYLKLIDLTKDRRQVPPVDEIAAISLDLWAREQGYSKIRQNLAGL
jgi:FdhE protein